MANLEHKNELDLTKTLSHDLKADIEEGGSAPAKLNRGLQGRHMQMIAIGGSIGAGLFINSGAALAIGGPGSLFVSYIVISFMVYSTVQALGELAVMYPVNGAFYSYASRFIDPSWGFALGWQYAIGFLLVLPYEIIAAGITIGYWKEYNIAIWMAVFMTLLILIQWFGVKGYGEVEFVLGIIKIAAIIGFIIFGIVVNTGGVSSDDRGYIGFRYWNDSASGNIAFKNGFKGFCSTFRFAAFSFSGTELVGLAAAEAVNPRTALPKACKQVIYRIAGFYILSLLIIGIIVPSSSADLLGGSGSNASPFVLAIKLAGVKGLDSVFNTVILISVISVANSCTYASSRTMQALAADGWGPKFLAYIDPKGRPLWPIVIQLAFGLLSLVNLTASGTLALYWMLAIGGLVVFFTWGSILLAHIRFRLAWTAQGRSLDAIPHRSPFGLIGSWVALFMVFLCLSATFYTALFPVYGRPNAESFFMVYLAAPISLSIFIGHKIWMKTWKLGTPLKEIDLDYGKRVFRVEHFEGEDDGVKKTWWKRTVGAFV